MPGFGTDAVRGDPNIVLRGIKAAFLQSLGVAAGMVQYPKYCQIVPSRAASEKYVFAGAFPKPRKWVDERQGAGGLVTFSYEITNERYEVTVEIDGDRLADDQVGIVLPWMQEAGMSIMLFRDEMFNTLREAGKSTACFDGQYFHYASHQMEAETAQSNYVSAGSFDVTVDGQRKLFHDAMMRLKKMTDSKGRPGVVNSGSLPGLTVTIPADATLYELWQRVLFGKLIADGGGFQPVAVDNQVKGLANLAVDPSLTDTNDLYIEVLGMPMKPYIFQEREKATVTILGTNSEHYVKTGNVLLTARERYAFGYGYWPRSLRYYR